MCRDNRCLGWREEKTPRQVRRCAKEVLDVFVGRKNATQGLHPQNGGMGGGGGGPLSPLGTVNHRSIESTCWNLILRHPFAFVGRLLLDGHEAFCRRKNEKKRKEKQNKMLTTVLLFCPKTKTNKKEGLMVMFTLEITYRSNSWGTNGRK